MSDTALASLMAVLVVAGLCLTIAGFVKAAKEHSGCAVGCFGGALLGLLCTVVFHSVDRPTGSDQASFAIIGALIVIPPLSAMGGAAIGAVIERVAKRLHK
jgi:hypothetical protein